MTREVIAPLDIENPVVERPSSGGCHCGDATATDLPEFDARAIRAPSDMLRSSRPSRASNPATEWCLSHRTTRSVCCVRWSHERLLPMTSNTSSIVPGMGASA